MICTKLWAGLGNQCFMLAAAISHSVKMNTGWGAPRKSLDPRIWRTYFTTPRDKATLFYYKEKNHFYEPLPEYNDLTIEGYFQSEKYFEKDRGFVTHKLGFSLDKKSFVAIHVRRGDYLYYPDRFPVLEKEYYEMAVDTMIAKGFDAFMVFSDDIPYCRQMFGKLGYHFAYSSQKDPILDMKLMYNAEAFIIANSTYSLFPALLRPDNPLVIAPAESRWYGPANNLETRDLMPERFIKI